MIGKILDAIVADRNATPEERQRSRRLMVITFVAVGGAAVVVLALVAIFGPPA
ncbi:MAG: hypothetical protein JNL42_00760 [Anaerolineae bacterium]|nr:hypothetical protein [Anaerolineae bacterium]